MGVGGGAERKAEYKEKPHKDMERMCTPYADSGPGQEPIFFLNGITIYNP